MKQSTRLRKFIWLLATIAVSLYLCLAVFAAVFGDRLLFHPRAPRYKDSRNILKIPLPAGGTLSARYLVNPQAGFTILYSHGTANDLAADVQTIDSLHDHGFSILEYDYRCYGTSSRTLSGRPTESTACADAEAAFRYLTDSRHIPPQQIILYGQSLGGGPATYLATRYPVAGLILESTFTSVFRVATRVPLLPFDKFPNTTRLHTIHCPVLIMHGTDDELISFWHGPKLFQAANEPKFSLWVPQAGHNNVRQLAGQKYWDTIATFQAALTPPVASHS